MMKFGANVTKTALKGLDLAQTGNYDHVLNLKYTCRALPSCLYSWATNPCRFFSPFLIWKKSYKAETNGSKMMKFGATVTQTAL